MDEQKDKTRNRCDRTKLCTVLTESTPGRLPPCMGTNTDWIEMRSSIVWCTISGSPLTSMHVLTMLYGGARGNFRTIIHNRSYFARTPLVASSELPAGCLSIRKDFQAGLPSQLCLLHLHGVRASLASKHRPRRFSPLRYNAANISVLPNTAGNDHPVAVYTMLSLHVFSQ